MRVQLLIDKLTPGGTQRHLMRLARELRTRGVDVHVTCLRERGAWGEALSSEGFPITALGCHSIIPPHFTRALGSVIRSINHTQPDILHCLLFSANVIGSIAARWGQGQAARRVIVSRRDTGFWLRSRHVWALRGVNRWVDHICCNSTAVAESRRAIEHWPASRTLGVNVSIIPNAVETMTFNDARTERASLGLRDDEWVVVSVARLRPEKGQATLIRAAHALRETLPALRILLVGDGAEESRLRELAASLGVDERVIFLGHREDVPEILHAANCAVLVSDSEGQSNFLLEGMAARLPIVASDVPGNREVLAAENAVSAQANASGGLLIPPRDPAALAEALLLLYANPDRAATLVRAARKIIDQHHTPTAEAEAYCALYQALVDGRK